jgi:pimeloyl-ACP methyl ester carboxylesterase
MGSFRHAEDLSALLDALDIAQATLIGFRHGANIAVECALDHPERVTAMALVQPFMDHSLDRYTPGADPALDRYMTGVDRFMTDLVYASAEPKGVKRMAKKLGVFCRMPSYLPANTKSIVVDKKQLRTVMRRMLTIGLSNFARTFRIVLGWPRWPQLVRDQRNPQRQEDERYRARWAQRAALERLAEIHAPTLIVLSESTNPADAQFAMILHDEIAGAQIAVVKGTMAFPQMEAPLQFQQVVTAFLEQQGYSPATHQELEG